MDLPKRRRTSWWLPPFHMPPYAGTGVPRIIGIEAPGFVAMVKMKGIIIKNEEGLTVALLKGCLGLCDDLGRRRAAAPKSTGVIDCTSMPV